MRTWKMIINPKKNKQDAAFCQYFKTNTADFKCMYNVANFYIRNTMTGIKKSQKNARTWRLKYCTMFLQVYRKPMKPLVRSE